MVQLSHPDMTTRKTIALITQTFVSKVMSLLFNMWSRFVIAFLPKDKQLLISRLQSLSTVILEPKKINLSLLPLFPHLFAMKWWDQMPVIQHKNLIIYFVSSYLFFWTFFNLTHFDFLDYILTIWSFDFLIPASRNYMFLNHAEPPWISDFCKMHISPFFWVSLNSCLFILYTVIHYCFMVSIALWPLLQKWEAVLGADHLPLRNS